MKAILGLLVAIGIIACAVAFGPGCATGPDPKPNPCIGSYEARKTMPCQCPGTLDPTCLPWLTDSTRRDAGQGDAR